MSFGTPLYFGPAQQLFGWYYAPSGETIRPAGVLLCPPLGHEYVCSYRAYRHIAERLAESGFPMLRFDYYGTGNSAGGPEDANLLHRWMESIATAADELKARSGTDTIALVGLRIGGTLAALTAMQRDDVSALILWEPCISGRSYVRQVKILGMTTAQVTSHACTHADTHADTREEQLAADIGVEAAGFMLTNATVDDLSEVHLTASTAQAHVRTLLLLRDDIPQNHTLAEHFTRRGATVDERTFEGYTSFMRAPIESELPVNAIDSLVQWTQQAYATTDTTQSTPPSNILDRSSPNTNIAIALPIQETAVHFGPSLFGIFTAPTTTDHTNTAAIFLNTGGDHHIGPHRLYVPLARDWATRGIGVLRFDLSGLGDSPTYSGEVENNSYPACAIDDVRAAVEYVREQGYEHIVLIGMCSGAYHAIHAAHQGVPVTATIAVNAPLYSQLDALTDDPYWRTTESLRFRRALFTPQQWRRVLTGQANYGNIISVLATHARITAATLLDTVSTLVTRGESNAPTNDIARLFPSHIRTHLIFSRSDPGYEYVQLAIGAELKTRHKHLNIDVQVVDDADHTFMPVALQNHLSTLLTDTILRLEPPSPSR